MSNNNSAYGTLGNEMRAAKDGRRNLMAGIRQNGRHIRRETGQVLERADKLVHEIGEANGRLASQTRQTMAKGRKDLRGRTRQTMSDIDRLLGAIRTDVTALKADAGRITTEARGFLDQIGSDNAALRDQTHKGLARARTRSKTEARHVLAEAGKVMAETKEVVAGLRAQTGQMLAETAEVMKGLCAVSRQRASAWQDIIRSMQNGRSPAPGTSHRTRPSATRRRKRKTS